MDMRCRSKVDRSILMILVKHRRVLHWYPASLVWLLAGWEVGDALVKLPKFLVGESVATFARTLSLGGGAELMLDELTPESLDFSLRHPLWPRPATPPLPSRPRSLLATMYFTMLPSFCPLSQVSSITTVSPKFPRFAMNRTFPPRSSGDLSNWLSFWPVTPLLMGMLGWKSSLPSDKALPSALTPPTFFACAATSRLFSLESLAAVVDSGLTVRLLVGFLWAS